MKKVQKKKNLVDFTPEIIYAHQCQDATGRWHFIPLYGSDTEEIGGMVDGYFTASKAAIEQINDHALRLYKNTRIVEYARKR